MMSGQEAPLFLREDKKPLLDPHDRAWGTRMRYSRPDSAMEGGGERAWGRARVWVVVIFCLPAAAVRCLSSLVFLVSAALAC